MPEYNGHPSWAAWNVSLWIHEEPIRSLAEYHRKQAGSAAEAARALILDLPTHTPDGARYTVSTLTRALRFYL